MNKIFIISFLSIFVIGHNLQIVNESNEELPNSDLIASFIEGLTKEGGGKCKAEITQNYDNFSKAFMNLIISVSEGIAEINSAVEEIINQVKSTNSIVSECKLRSFAGIVSKLVSSSEREKLLDTIDKNQEVLQEDLLKIFDLAKNDDFVAAVKVMGHALSIILNFNVN